jgi:hypothetical protein
MRRGLTDVLPPLRAFCELATDGERLLERAMTQQRLSAAHGSWSKLLRNVGVKVLRKGKQVDG